MEKIRLDKNFNDLDYVRIYALKMKRDNSFFLSQKNLIENQMRSSKSVFFNSFKSVDEKDFKNKARDYLRKVGLIIEKS